MLQAQEQNQEQTQDQQQTQNPAQYQTARPNEDQQVIQALQYESRSHTQLLIATKIEGAKGTAVILTMFLLLVTIVRFFIRRRRLAALKVRAADASS